MNCLVTGGAGFIGSNIAEALYGRGDTVTVLDNLSTGHRENISEYLNAPRFRFIEGTITSPETCVEACRGIDVVFHHAALVNVPASIEDPAGTMEINVRGTVNIFDAARQAGVRTIVWASSTAVYGNAAILPTVETTPLSPLSPYAASKAAGEMFAHAYHAVFGMHIVGFRYFNVFGKKQDPSSPYSAVIPLFITRIRRGEPVTIFGDGGQTRDFVHVSDVVQANLKAAESGPETGGRAYNIGSGVTISVNRLYDLLAAELGSNLRPSYSPGREGEVRDSVADISAARKAFGYKPEVNFAEGLRETIEWFRRQG